MKEKRTRTVIKHKPKTIAIATIAIVLFAIAFCLISSSLNIKKVKDEVILNYNTYSNADYKVNLKENNYFTEKTLQSGEQYITSVIDNIEIDYNYNYSSAKNITGDYSYKIVANVNADYKVDTSTTKKVWSKDYILKEIDNEKINNESNINISEKVKINYDEYNKIINDFKRDYMLAISSKVDIYMYVTLNGKYQDNNFEEKTTLLTSIPLSEQTINITTDYKSNIPGKLVKQVDVGRFNNIYIFITGVVCLILALIIIIKQIIKIIKDDKKQSDYIKKLKKYMHDYNDVIATVKSLPNIRELKKIELTKFEELINAQDDLRVPIIFCETKKNEEGKFYLITQDCAYYYVLKEDK
ncbi:MAG: DUF5305 family protein [Bacilli bacterium]